MSFIKAMLVFQGLGMARGAHHVCNGPKEPLIPGIMPGASKPKIILAQDIDWPRYAYLGVPPESDFEVAGIGHDIAMGLETVCNLSMTVVEMKWSKCWGNAIIGKGLEHGEVHGCMTYTHTYGARNRFMEFSRPILKDNKPAGLLVRLQNGVPVINGANNLNGLKVVDVVGWAPTADTLALAENKCTKERFTGFTMVQPTVTTANANNDALATLLNGDADAMWVYADQAKNYQCSEGVTANWDCDLWAGFGTTFAYIQTGLFGHAMAGTTLSMSKKGSGLSEILNPCIDKFILTKDYYDICVKHGFDGSCFENEHFPATQATELVWEKPTDQLTTTCAVSRCIESMVPVDEHTDGMSCPICLDVIQSADARKLHCDHCFHGTCLVAWGFHSALKHPRKRWMSVVQCPLCRQDHRFQSGPAVSEPAEFCV